MKNTKDIPRGYYCYDERGDCPYWDINPELPKQANGVCNFLGKSDQDLNKEYAETLRTEYSEDKSIEGKLYSEVYGEPLEFSLIWDQVKECGENNPTKEEADVRARIEVKDGIRTEHNPRAVIKFNSGHGAILCSTCSVIVKEGHYNFTEVEQEAFFNNGHLDPYYCDECKQKIMEYNNER